MKLKVNDYSKSVEFGRSYIYRVLFNRKGDNFEDWLNEITIYRR